ncbi:PhoH family protein [Sulfurospirillum sp. MES]|uniref:PhoH family protein n=1 Tax=Sulfurospirillum sp. MES TaxID=1565314 RepID=UPI0005431BB4|nr:PhoH family protein [Sulfurospirillum sp. MES]KHG33866.1 MAG: phosphate starvation protein PhoH [Sulfurospirillum sp. MES]
MSVKKVYVLDTNIILHNTNFIKELCDNGNNIIVIPETVLIELEDFKKNFTELGYQARSFARMLASCKVVEVDSNADVRVVKMRFEDTIAIHLFSKNSYESDMNATFLNESNDKRIVEAAAAAKEYYAKYKVIFLSLDVYARMFGLFHNVTVESLREDRSDVPEFEFVKQLNVDSALFNTLDKKLIGEYDPEHKSGNYSYEFMSSDGNSAHAIISPGGIIHMLNEELDFRGLEVKPINLKQKFFMKALLSNMYDIHVIDARAGSGKTLMAFVAAMRLVSKGSYEKIVYVRNSIESVDKGADVGYLSGNDEKFRIYNMALYDTLEFIAKKKMKRRDSTQEPQMAIEKKVQELITKYNIEKLWPGEARGRTLSNAIVILDEWQNSSNNTTQLILSRLDNNCKAIVIGSNRQIDNMYLNRYNNGLTSLLKQTKKEQTHISLFAIELDKSVRGKFSHFADEIFGDTDKHK